MQIICMHNVLDMHPHDGSSSNQKQKMADQKQKIAAYY